MFYTAPGEPVPTSGWSFIGITGTLNSSSSGNITVEEPAATTAGDLQIVGLAYRGNAGFTAPAGAGWSLVDQNNLGNISTSASTAIASVAMFWRVRESSGGGNQVFTRTGGNICLTRMLAYRPASGTISLDTYSINTAGSNAATVTTAGISSSVANTLTVVCASGGDNVALSGSGVYATDPPNASGTTQVTTTGSIAAQTFRVRSADITSLGADTAYVLADAVKSSAGATGTISATIGGVSRSAIVAAIFKSIS